MIKFSLNNGPVDPGVAAIHDIVTQSPMVRSLIQEGVRVARSTAPVLLTGESGTGKELFSRLIHFNSKRKNCELIKVNCAAFQANLVESELFGHERGAFTDAVHQRKGCFELADGGTLLLDEISEIPLATQAKLLRAIEECEIQRVGGNEVIKTDIRIIATSNLDLAEQVRLGKFRLDLYHRIGVVPLRLPSLRERIVDLPLLSIHFVDRFKFENDIEIKGLTSAAMRLLSNYYWPGNIREFRNCLHRACIISNSELIDTECFSQLNNTIQEDVKVTVPENWLHLSLADIERRVIRASVEKFGSKKAASEVLGITPRTLTNKINFSNSTPETKRAA